MASEKPAPEQEAKAIWAADNGDQNIENLVGWGRIIRFAMLNREAQRERDADLASARNAPAAFHQHLEYIRGREAAAAAILADGEKEKP